MEISNSVYWWKELSVIMKQLPVSGKWTREERERWLRALEAVVDVCIDVRDIPPAEVQEEEKWFGEGLS